MLKNGQTYFKNLAVFNVWPFLNMKRNKGLNLDKTKQNLTAQDLFHFINEFKKSQCNRKS